MARCRDRCLGVDAPPQARLAVQGQSQAATSRRSSTRPAESSDSSQRWGGGGASARGVRAAGRRGLVPGHAGMGRCGLARLREPSPGCRGKRETFHGGGGRKRLMAISFRRRPGRGTDLTSSEAAGCGGNREPEAVASAGSLVWARFGPVFYIPAPGLRSWAAPGGPPHPCQQLPGA